MGQSPKGTSYNEEENGTLFFQGRSEFTNRFPVKRLYTTEPKRMAEKLDVLVSVRAPVGDVNIAYENCCIGRGLSAVKSSYKSYALYKIKSLKPNFDLFESEGTVFGSINKNSFSNIEVIIPSKSKIQEFENIVVLIDEKIYNNATQIQTLKQTRDTLLPKHSPSENIFLRCSVIVERPFSKSLAIS
jgi:type I restriction enzyme S subunit